MQQQRASDGQALPLASAELVRIATERLVRAQTDRNQRLLHAVPGLGPRPGEVELADRHGEQMIDSVKRVEDFERILKNRLDLATEISPAASSQLAEVCAPVQDVARRGLRKTQRQSRERRLAAATFAGDRRERGDVAIDCQRKVVEREGTIARPTEQFCRPTRLQQDSRAPLRHATSAAGAP